MRTHGKTKLDRGIGIYKGTVYVRIFAKGRPIKVSIGKVTDPGVISTARAELAKLREAKRLNKLGRSGNAAFRFWTRSNFTSPRRTLRRSAPVGPR
jgi:hypothetical protein